MQTEAEHETSAPSVLKSGLVRFLIVALAIMAFVAWDMMRQADENYQWVLYIDTKAPRPLPPKDFKKVFNLLHDATLHSKAEALTRKLTKYENAAHPVTIHAERYRHPLYVESGVMIEVTLRSGVDDYALAFCGQLFELIFQETTLKPLTTSSGDAMSVNFPHSRSWVDHEPSLILRTWPEVEEAWDELWRKWDDYWHP